MTRSTGVGGTAVILYNTPWEKKKPALCHVTPDIYPSTFPFEYLIHLTCRANGVVANGNCSLIWSLWLQIASTFSPARVNRSCSTNHLSTCEALVHQGRTQSNFSFCRIPIRFVKNQGQDGPFTKRSPCLCAPFHAWSPCNSRGSRPLPRHPKSDLFPPFANHPTPLVHPQRQTDSEEPEDTHSGLYGMRRGKRTIAMGQGTSASSRENRSHERSGRPILASWNLGQQS